MIATVPTADAFADLVSELRSTGRPIEELAAEIASDYEVNPAFLIRRFNEQYPEGLPEVDLAKAQELEARVNEQERQRELAERQAIIGFFAQNPTAFRRAPRAAQQIVAEVLEGEVLRGFVQKAIAMWANRYETEAGEIVRAATIGDVRSNLVQLGISAARYDMSDFERAGVRVVRAQYVGGARKTGKFVQVAVLDPAA